MITLPKFTFTRTKVGRVLWHDTPGFVEWLTPLAPERSNHELAALLTKLLGHRVTHSAAASLRRGLAAPMAPASAKRALQERLTSTPTPKTLRLLGPDDAEFFVRISGDTIVTSDWHIPHHKEELLDRMLAVAKSLKISQLIINGDFLNQDAFSRWKGHPFQSDWKVEKGIAKHILETLYKTFDRIYYILDNHDRRIIAAHERPSQFTEDDVLDILRTGAESGKLRASVFYHYVIVNNIWRVTSPKEYRRQKLSLPSRLADLYDMHVISGGDHLFGLGMNDSGRRVIANNMCMTNPKETPYINVQDTTYPHWNTGFYVILDDRLYPFCDHPNLWPMWWEHVDRKAMQRAAIRPA